MNRGTGYRKLPYGARVTPWHLHPKATRAAVIPITVDLTIHTPPIFDQGGTGSCVGHATVCAIMTSLSAASAPVDELLCPLSPYQMARVLDRAQWSKTGALPALTDSGTDPGLAMQAITEWGVETCQAMLGVDGPGASYTEQLTSHVNNEPNLFDLEQAHGFEVVGQYQVMSQGQQRTNEVVAALASGFAVCFAAYASDDRFQVYTGGVMADPPAGSPCNHYLYCFGYRTENGKRIFFGRNSWSQNWGVGGTFEFGEGMLAASDGVFVMAVRKEIT